METTNRKLRLLQNKVINTEEKIVIMIFGLGSVGLYLLDYLVSLANPRLEFVVPGRNIEKLHTDVNIIRTAATIRGQYRGNIYIDKCNFEDVDSLTKIIEKWNPDFIVNSSRVYSGLKYGSISWSNLRAYGIWSPLSVKFSKNIMTAYEKAQSNAIAINTSYSDAVIPWLKSSGMSYFDFGSGNLNHLIPRMKFYISEHFDIENLNEIDITLATSHFHDVVISKEGHDENQNILINVSTKGNTINFNYNDMLKACKIAMPVDQKRNMMNASSNFNIINSILDAIINRKRIKFHSPGAFGEIGGFPIIIDGTGIAKAYVDDSVFSIEVMRQINRKSIYLDGIEDIVGGELIYTDELLSKVENIFKTKIPKRVVLSNADKIAEILINKLILPTIN